MRKLMILGLALMGLLWLTGCDLNSPTRAERMDLNLDTDNSSLDRRGHHHSYPADAGAGVLVGYTLAQNPEYGIYSYTLWADRDENVGEVTLTTNAAGHPVVNVVTNSLVALADVAIWVWDAPSQIPDRRPNPGHADYRLQHVNADQVTLELVDHTATCGEIRYLAVRTIIRAAEDEDDDEDDEDEDEDEDHDHDHDHEGDHHGPAWAGGTNVSNGFPTGHGHWWGYVTYAGDCRHSVSGTVYLDSDASFSLEPGEAGIAMNTVNLFNGSGTLLAVDTTDALGAFTFSHLPAGADYFLTSTLPDPAFQPAENGSGVFFANLITDQVGVHFGYLNQASISGVVYEDVNDSGDLDPDDLPLTGFSIILLDEFDQVLDQVLTDPDGLYSFTGLMPGATYLVEVDENPVDLSPVENASGALLLGLTGDVSGVNFGFSSSTTVQNVFGFGTTTFIDLGITPAEWGWQIETDVFTDFAVTDLYANAFQNNLSNGTLVGELAYGYEPWSETFMVEYQMNQGWALTETQLYVSNIDLGNIDPAGYGNAHILNNTSSDLYSIPFLDDGDGLIHLVAHAVITSASIFF